MVLPNMSELSMFHSVDEAAPNVSFNTTVGTTISSRDVGTVKFKVLDYRGDFRIITFTDVYNSTRVQRSDNTIL